MKYRNGLLMALSYHDRRRPKNWPDTALLADILADGEDVTQFRDLPATLEDTQRPCHANGSAYPVDG